MIGKRPSLTARGAAEHRAAHQTLENGVIFSDSLACTILGESASEIAEKHAARPQNRPMRLYIAARSRFAEDALSVAQSRGIRQAVVLGAGLDTFGLRNPHSGTGLRVFEVDHPDSQAWKLQRLAQENIKIPPTLTFVPVDFEKQSLGSRLGAFGFKPDNPAFFFWLGVVSYLSREAVLAVLRFVGSLPRSEIAFDYSEPLENASPKRRAYREALRERVASGGEPLVSHFEPSALMDFLQEAGFDEIEDIPIGNAIARYLGRKEPPFEKGGAHLMRARRAMARLPPPEPLLSAS